MTFSVEKKRIVKVGIFSILSVALVAGTFVYLERRRLPFVITAPSGPIKTVPQERGGMHIPKSRNVHKALVEKKDRPAEQRTILGTFPTEKLAQRAVLRFISLAPDIFSKTPSHIERDEGGYLVVVALSPHDRKVVCRLIESQDGSGHCATEFNEDE